MTWIARNLSQTPFCTPIHNHGIGNDGSWFEVSDTFSTRWGERELACRLLTAR